MVLSSDEHGGSDAKKIELYCRHSAPASVSCFRVGISSEEQVPTKEEICTSLPEICTSLPDQQDKQEIAHHDKTAGGELED